MKRMELCRAIGAVADAINRLDEASHSEQERDALSPVMGRLDAIIEDLDAMLNGDETRDEAYERAAARARNNDFADTNGRDWT